MAAMVHVGSGGICERELFVIEASSADDVPTPTALNCPNFACLIAWDASVLPMQK